MDTLPTPLLDAPLLAAAGQLTLAARRLVAGAVAGLHPSLHPGRSHDFSQYRAYQPGDEPRHIDWKLFARSDRFFLRESDVDTRIAIALVLDATASMQHRGSRSDDPRKFDRARSLAAAFALVAETQGDPMALHVVSNGDISSVSTAGRRQPFRQIVHHLAALEPQGRWPTEPHRLSHAMGQTHANSGSTGPAATRQLTVVLTDGHEHDGEIQAALSPLRARQHEVLFLHFIAREECDFPYQGPVLLEEWETGRTLETDASAVRQQVLDAQKASRRAWFSAWGDSRFDYLPILSDQPLDRCLHTLLRRRTRH
ncbi:MAG: DUF58 domain-containing protein [Planctomycetota bacterium]|nr:DUF58 domain-containing protein [Planctomycetota bacterium]